MNDELIEQVARACCIANDCDPDTIHEGSPIWVDWTDEAIAALQPHIAAEREDAARRALEAAAIEAWATRNGTIGLCDCEDCISQNIRAIDLAQFRGWADG